MPRYESGYGNSLFMTVPSIRDIRAAQLCLPPGKVPMFSVSQAAFPQSITSHRPYKLEALRYGEEPSTVISLTPKNIYHEIGGILKDVQYLSMIGQVMIICVICKLINHNWIIGN